MNKYKESRRPSKTPLQINGERKCLGREEIYKFSLPKYSKRLEAWIYSIVAVRTFAFKDLLQHLATAISVYTENGGHAIVVIHKFTSFGLSIQTSFLRSKKGYCDK